MLRIRQITIFWLFLFLWTFSTAQASNQALKPYILLVSIDGYRYDYTDQFQPPNLMKLREEGLSAQSLVPVFPSKTFPSHYSMVTGLYPEEHGIVSNNFYDFSRPVGSQFFTISDPRVNHDGSWFGGLTLWAALEKQGMRSASFFWPGGEAEIQGVRPTYTRSYDEKISNTARVKQVLDWLKLPEETRPHLITLYFSEVDEAGHTHGPVSKQTEEAVLHIDTAMGELREGLSQLDFDVNLIVVSDHGMQELDSEKVEYLDDYTDLSEVTVGDWGTQALLYAKNQSKLEKVYSDLKSKAQHFSVYKKSEVPDQYHYSKNSRIGDLVVLADAPYFIGVHDPKFKVSKGNHGYDPTVTKTMHGIFYAYGPNLKERTKIKSFENIHIYPLILKILDLPVSSEIDGDIRVLKDIQGGN